MAVKGKKSAAQALGAPGLAPKAEAAGEGPALSLPRFSPWMRLFIYAMCVVLPGGALALGVLYYRQEDQEARGFGRICLGLGLLGLVLRMGGGGELRNMQAGESLTQPFR
jgi:hypothetical protein